MLAPRLTVCRTGLATLAVQADQVRISQILSNLLDNARRHTPPGGTITADLAAAADQATLTITDTGPGLPEGDRQRIFQRLVRLSDARDRDSGGAGLGLPIALASPMPTTATWPASPPSVVGSSSSPCLAPHPPRLMVPVPPSDRITWPDGDLSPAAAAR